MYLTLSQKLRVIVIFLAGTDIAELLDGDIQLVKRGTWCEDYIIIYEMFGDAALQECAASIERDIRCSTLMIQCLTKVLARNACGWNTTPLHPLFHPRSEASAPL